MGCCSSTRGDERAADNGGMEDKDDRRDRYKDDRDDRDDDDRGHRRRSTSSRRRRRKKESTDVLVDRCGLDDDTVQFLIDEFKYRDVDKSGGIDEPELKEVMKGLGIVLSQQALHQILGDVGAYSADIGDYQIRLQEFVRLLAPYMRVKPSTQLRESQLKKLKTHFSAIDKNGNGTIETDELYDLFIDAGMKKTDDEIDTLMRRYDADNNGVLSFDEFIQMVLETM